MRTLLSKSGKEPVQFFASRASSQTVFSCSLLVTDIRGVEWARVCAIIYEVHHEQCNGIDGEDSLFVSIFRSS